jgi:hypothetical protein
MMAKKKPQSRQDRQGGLKKISLTQPTETQTHCLIQSFQAGFFLSLIRDSYFAISWQSSGLRGSLVFSDGLATVAGDHRAPPTIWPACWIKRNKGDGSQKPKSSVNAAIRSIGRSRHQDSAVRFIPIRGAPSARCPTW